VRVVDLDIGASKSDICADRVVIISERAGRTRRRLPPSRAKPPSISMPRPIRQIAACRGEGPGACEGVGAGDNGYPPRRCLTYAKPPIPIQFALNRPDDPFKGSFGQLIVSDPLHRPIRPCTNGSVRGISSM
jgi:hypothetical protein